jgi:hypothetical protein
MFFIGYDFSLTEEGVGLDQELNLDKLGWKEGDYFKLINNNGRACIVRVNVVEQFLKNGTEKWAE